MSRALNIANNLNILKDADFTLLSQITSNSLRADLQPTFSLTAKATGGTLYIHHEDGNIYVCHKFFSDGNFILNEDITADILVVAGGGGGGYQVGGGGGAGGLIYRPSKDLTADTYVVGIGLGGDGAPNASNEGTVGENSTFGSLLTAIGGGRGANHNTSMTRSKDGGSGGGGSGNNLTVSEAGGTATQSSQSGDSGVYGFGFDGGQGEHSVWSGGGGGGAGAMGRLAIATPDNIGGEGGEGKYFGDKFGTSVGEDGWFAGGGGGCSSTTYGLVQGGRGGGAKGSGNYGYYYKQKTHGDDGMNNTGGGGGGVRDRYDGSNDYTRAGNGGSGIVIVRYKVAEYA